MKRIIYSILVAIILLPSCQTDPWLDWKTENQMWLTANARRKEVKTTPSGLQYEVLREGYPSQPRPDNLKTVVVNYTGSLISGNVFDSNEESSMAVSELISGFSEGLKLMTPPAHYRLYIPYDLGYGKEGTGTEGVVGYIPPYSTLVFDVELLEVY